MNSFYDEFLLPLQHKILKLKYIHCRTAQVAALNQFHWSQTYKISRCSYGILQEPAARKQKKISDESLVLAKEFIRPT